MLERIKIVQIDMKSIFYMQLYKIQAANIFNI
jgi:hypothetical protein